MMIRDHIGHWLFAIMVLGYPVAASIVQLLGVDSQVVTIPFRALVCFVAIGVLAGGFFRPFHCRAPRLLLLFFFIYFLRLGYDWTIADLPGAAAAMLIFLGATVLPCIAVWMSIGRHIDVERLGRILFVLGSVFLALYYITWLSGQTNEVMFNKTEGRAGLDALGPISLATASASVFLTAIFMLYESQGLIQRGKYLVVAGASIPPMLLSGSRGPLIGLLLATAWFGLSRLRRLPIVIALFASSLFLIPGGSLATNRLIELFGGVAALDISALQRLAIQRSALDDFTESPVFGKHFLDPAWGEGFYPHNITIETAMAMGLVGLVILGLLYWKAVVAVLRPASSKIMLVTLLLSQYFVATQLSGALWASDRFFLLLGIALLATERYGRRICTSPLNLTRPASVSGVTG